MKNPLRTGFLLFPMLALVPAPAIADPTDRVVIFSIQPEAGGRARYIDRVTFRICQIRNRDPWDDAACEGWRSFQNGFRLQFVGRFCIYAEWDDHRTYRSSVELQRTGASFVHKIEPRQDKGTCT